MDMQTQSLFTYGQGPLWLWERKPAAITSRDDDGSCDDMKIQVDDNMI